MVVLLECVLRLNLSALRPGRASNANKCQGDTYTHIGAIESLTFEELHCHLFPLSHSLVITIANACV